MVYLGKIQASLCQIFSFLSSVHEILVPAMFYRAHKDRGVSFYLQIEILNKFYENQIGTLKLKSHQETHDTYVAIQIRS